MDNAGGTTRIFLYFFDERQRVHILSVTVHSVQFYLSTGYAVKNVHKVFYIFSVRIPSQLKPISALSVKA